MTQIKGIDIVLINRIETEKDLFGTEIYKEKRTIVKNVLVSPIRTEDIVNNKELEGKKAVYTIAIPKGDTNIWENQKVEFFGKTWKVFGSVTEGIESMIPLSWNKQYKVENYE